VTGDGMRDQLAAALPESLGDIRFRRRPIPAIGQPASITGYGDRLLDALLPVVRKIAADAIRAEADELREVALRAEGQQWNPHRVWTWLSDRADVLDPT
jgi:hypothetical protein